MAKTTENTKAQGTKKNIEKKDKAFTSNVTEVYAVFAEAVNNRPGCKINFSDAKSQQYAGLDDFSVNMKKSFYNVYMSEANAELCKKQDKDLEVLENPSDTTKKQLRCRLIRFEDFDVLKKCISAVVETRFAQ